MGIGGNVLFFLTPVCVESLIKTVNLLSEYKIKIKTLGKGTNIIAADKDLDFAVIATSELSSFKAGEDFIIAESGCTMKKISRKSFERGLSGIEFLFGIPGSIGGGIRMNAGAYGDEIGSKVIKVRCLDPSSMTVFDVNSEEMDFGYRNSIFKKKGFIVLDALLKLKKESAEKIERSLYDYESKRVKSQPIELRSAGSVFKKPFPDFHVGKVIEEIGLKGKKSGGLMISEKHAGFIINFNNGTFYWCYFICFINC